MLPDQILLVPGSQASASVIAWPRGEPLGPLECPVSYKGFTFDWDTDDRVLLKS